MEGLFTKKQLEQISSKSIGLDQVEEQINNFKEGFPFLKVIKPATVNDGILSPDEKEIESKVEFYNKFGRNYEIVKFVPASGAASRMFKDLFQFLSKVDEGIADIEVNIDSAKKFFGNIRNFAFYNDLKNEVRKDDRDLDKMVANRQYALILKYLLTDMGLKYGNLPKGLLKFHAYEGFSRTPVEEHYVESAEYAKQKNGRSNLHFTVSPEHIELFQKQFEECEYHLEEKYKINYDVSYSVQKPSTDIIAVDMDNNPFVEEDGSLLFRPGGHGALLENLNDLEGDVVFIKNIDNVVPDHLKGETIKYKKVLAAILIDIKDKVFSYIHKLAEENNEIDSELLTEIKSFIGNNLSYNFSDNYEGLDKEKQVDALLEVLNRPIRVCGMVKNEGEPGGGPFWVKMKDGSVSLQIVESGQVDLNNPGQRNIMESSTHFNPVDIVCYKKDYTGKPHDLLKYRDPETGFISKKSKGGKDLKAQELPGLWNGSMAKWNTVFVEVPLITFNPVKTVNDLLRPQHRRQEDED